MDEAVIPLRAHHGLCLRFFQGKGYSGAFVENMARKKAMLEENPLVRLTDQADEIYRACPNNLSGQCESAEKVRRWGIGAVLFCVQSRLSEMYCPTGSWQNGCWAAF